MSAALDANPPPPRSPLVVVWRVWERCGLACQFCGYSRDRAGTRRAAEPRMILDFARVLRDVQQACRRPVLLSWLGGEPLGWGALPEISRRCAGDFGLGLAVTTNGLPLASRRVRASLLADYRQLTVSIDGLADVHDRLRGQRGLFRRVRRLVLRLRAAARRPNLLLRANTILMGSNIDAFPALCEELATWGFHELTFNQLGGVERPAFYASERLRPAQVERFAAELPALRRRLQARGLSIRGSAAYLARMAATAACQPLRIEDCQPATDYLFIDASGRISPCSLSSAAYGIPVSSVRSASQFLALAGRLRRQQQRERLAACDDCHATHVFGKFNAGQEALFATDTD